MTGLRTTTKARLGFKGAKAAAKHPRATRLAGWTAFGLARRLGPPVVKRLGPPVAKRRARRRAQQLGHTAPRVAAGFVLGAGTAYLLEPARGAEHRTKLRELVSG